MDRRELDTWERAFDPDLEKATRLSHHSPWIGGTVHVLKDLPAQREPVQSGGLCGFQLLSFQPHSRVLEHFEYQRPHFDGGPAGHHLSIATPEVGAQRCWTSWDTDGFGFTSIMLTSDKMKQAT